MVFLYNGAHIVLLCIPLPSLTGRVESTRGLPFAGNISENAAKWNKRWRESTHTPESKTPHSLMRFRYSFDNVPGNLFAPGASSQGPGRQEGQLSECLPFAGDVTKTAAKWNEILWELFSPFPPQGSNPWAAHLPRNQIHSAPSAAVRSAPWRQQQYSRGVATLLSPKPGAPSPGPLFFVFGSPSRPQGSDPWATHFPRDQKHIALGCFWSNIEAVMGCPRAQQDKNGCFPAAWKSTFVTSPTRIIFRGAVPCQSRTDLIYPENGYTC